jgi:16S rRNA (guanine527-N7)-methyltransferase
MNHSRDRADVIESAASAIGVELDSVQVEAITHHLDMVLERRSAINLISESTVPDAVRVHIVDSLAAAPLLVGRTRIIDIGSGAGYPGIPLAAALNCEVVLVESRKKRALFLQEVLESLEPLGVRGTVVNERAESQAALSVGGPADAVVARAVASLPTLVELAAPYLVSGGVFVALKGSMASEELERGDCVGALVGLTDRNLMEYPLHGGDENRSLVSYVRTSESEVELPRRVGRASKSPLA